MKKYLLFISLALFNQLLFAQVLSDSLTPKVQPTITSVKLPPLSPEKVGLIRNDTRALKIQMDKLSDSVGVLKTKVDLLNNSVKDGASQLSDELRAALQSELIRLQQSMESMYRMTQKTDSIRKSVMGHFPAGRF